MIFDRKWIDILLTLALPWLPVLLCGQLPGEITSDELGRQRMYIEASQARILGANDEAANLYREILSQDPDNDAAAYEYSRVLFALENYEEALNQIDLALRYRPDNTWYWVMRGDILERLENYPEAIAAYDKLIALNPKEQYYYQHQVELLLATRQFDKALAVLDKYEEQFGMTPETTRQKVRIYENRDELQKARDEVVRLAEIYSRDTEILRLAAVYSLKAGDQESAEQYYNDILTIDPDDSAANVYFASRFKARGEDAEYLESIIPLMQNSAIDIDAKVTELIPYLEKYTANPDAEFGTILGNVIAELVKHHASDAKAHALYADYLSASGMPIEAISEYKKTLAIDKSVYDVWEQLMYLQAEIQDMDGLLRTSENALDVFPNQASVYYLRGLAYAYKEDLDLAEEELQQAIIMSGRNRETRFHVLHLMGQVYSGKGQIEKAADAFDKALEIAPDDPALLAQYSNMLLEENLNLKKADQLARRALDARPEDPSIEHTIAMIAYAAGDLKTAEEFINRSMDHGGGDSYVILEHYGDILFSGGKVDEAVELWQLSLDAGNPSSVLDRKIAERRIIH